MLRIVCLKWSDRAWERTYERPRFFRYTAAHVNRLARMVGRNLALAHEVVCITDDADGIDDSVRTVPLWGIGGADRYFHKLALFSPEMAETIGPRFVFLDLDCVVVGDLTPLFDRPDDFVIWRGRRTAYNVSLFLMDAGARRQVWQAFDPADWADPGAALRRLGPEQAFICDRLGEEAVYTRDDGVLIFPRDCRWSLPPDARIVFFNGNRDPSRYRRVPWIAQHWR